MTRNSTLLLFLLLLVFQTNVLAQQENIKKTTRPTVGLVLSGGGAKGFAYVGILKAIQQAGLHLDYIGGTSMGSIMGGLYAVGYSPETIENIIKSQNWDMLLHDKISRKYLAMEEKGFTENSITTLPLKKNKIGLNQSLYQGQQINLLLNNFFSPAFEIQDFSNLPTPFFCMGTNILNGKSVMLKTGYLPMAIRSSMSIPGYFSPTYYQGKYLVDGGVVDNYPALQMKKLGLDIIVGADVQDGLKNNIKELNSLPAIANQIISYSRQDANKEGYAVTNKYIHIHVPYDIMAFNDYDSIIAIGDRVAKKYYPQIKALADSLNAIEYIPVRKKDAHPLEFVDIAKVYYAGNKKVSRKFLENYFGQFNNKKVALNEIDKMIRMAYGTKYFSHVFYELKTDGDKFDLMINVKESSPGALGVALHYDSDYQGSILFNIVMRNWAGKNSKLFAQTTLGTNPRFKALYLLDKGPHLGLGAELDAFSFNFDSYYNNIQQTNYKFTNFATSLFLNANLKNLYNIRTGVELERFKFNETYVQDSLAVLSNKINTFGSVFFRFKADTYDKSYFPTKGFRLFFNFKYIFNLTPDEYVPFFDNTSVAYINYNINFKLTDKWVMNTGAFQGITLGKENPVSQYNYFLGGQNPKNYMDNFVAFTGLRFVEETGKNLSVARFGLRYNYAKNLYASLAFDGAMINNQLSNYFDKPDIITGYGLTLSYMSFIGPVEVSLMGSNKNQGAMVYFNLGYWF
ncbi:MAG: patatin-like phospholipase family protein [Bacteroidales bacterium]|nr:patatin-like phospholipase family protein [Bacteroidales bacterium]